jgi:hypothetical protein
MSTLVTSVLGVQDAPNHGKCIHNDFIFELVLNCCMSCQCLHCNVAFTVKFWDKLGSWSLLVKCIVWL